MDMPVDYAASDGVATITINRPDAMNALDTAAKVALRDAIQRGADDTTVRAVVITGSGRAFCVGQDLKEHIDNLEHAPEEVWASVAEHFIPIATGLRTMDKPVIAAVNGVAAGAGASIAFACDFRIGSEAAAFNTAFAGIGLSCDTGASYTLPRLVGIAKATELLLTPRTVAADEALGVGLLHQLVPAAELSGVVAQFAATLAAGPTLAYASIKRAITFAQTHTFAESLEFEAAGMELTGGSDDHRGAVAAFVAKQEPVFTGR